MTDQPTDLDPQHLPVEFENVIPDDAADIEVADDQTPEPDTDTAQHEGA